jgi:hypothetical protein
VAHYHVPDHDGDVQHFEMAHGGHAPAITKADGRQTARGPEAPGGAVASRSVNLDAVVEVCVLPVVVWSAEHPARPPPGALRTRAPPLLS